MSNTVKETKLENSSIKLEIEIPADRVEQEFKKVFNKLQKEVKIDGFRKGKVPMNMLEKRFSREAAAEVAENLMKAGVIEFLEESSYTPVASPKYEVEKIVRGEKFCYTATVDLYPTVELGEYRGIAVEEKTCTVEDSDIEKEIDRVREHFKTSEAKPEGSAVEKGDMVNLSYKKSGSDAPAKSYSSIAGEDDDEFSVENNVLGMKQGEEKEISIKYPDDYKDSELAGSEVKYTVKINNLSHDVIPEMTDEIARKAQFESVDDMRKKTREMIDHFVANNTTGEAKSDILNKIVENSKFDLPESLIEAETKAAVQRSKEQLAARMGVSADAVEKYTEDDVAAIMGMMPENYKNLMRDDAEKSVKTMLVLSEVVKKEGLRVTEARYEEFLSKQAEQFGKTLDEFRDVVDEANLKEKIEKDLIIEVAVDWLYEQANVTKLPPVSLDALFEKK